MPRTPPASDAPVYRLGGGTVENLRLKAKEKTLIPPGISVFVGGSSEEAAGQVRLAFPNATRLLEAAETVGTTTVEAIRRAGFDVIPDPTRHFPNHARLVHPDGVAGFGEANLHKLAGAFKNLSRN